MERLHLSRGESFVLSKEAGLQRLRINLEWHSAVDLDAVAFCLTDEGIIAADYDFVYYKSNHRAPMQTPGETDTRYLDRISPEPYDRARYGAKANWLRNTVPLSTDGSVTGSADDSGKGVSGHTSGETMHVDLSKVRPEITSIIFCVTVYNVKGKEKKSFRDVPEASVTVYNADSGEKLGRYVIAEENKSGDAMIVAGVRLSRDGEWEFAAIGDSYDGGLQTLVDMHV